MGLFAFTAKCQSKDIEDQYWRYNVRCFDLRIKMNGHLDPVVVHNKMEYAITSEELYTQLYFLNSQKDCWVRVLLDVRCKKQYTPKQVSQFRNFCAELEERFSHIKFWCGRNLYNWKEDYEFKYSPTCEEEYSSVCYPKFLDDWWPWLYASLHNRGNWKRGTDKAFMMMDFVDLI
jgi:hypothetical protein